MLAIFPRYQSARHAVVVVPLCGRRCHFWQVRCFSLRLASRARGGRKVRRSRALPPAVFPRHNGDVPSNVVGDRAPYPRPKLRVTLYLFAG